MKPGIRKLGIGRQGTFKLQAFILLAVSLALGMFHPTSAQEVLLEQQVFDIARELRCPVCTSESVADSNAEISIQMRNIIQEKLEAGESEREIKAFFQARYGDWILLEPPRRGLHLLVWLLPLMVGLLGAAMLALFVRRWTRAAKEPVEVDEAGLERVRRELRQS